MRKLYFLLLTALLSGSDLALAASASASIGVSVTVIDPRTKRMPTRLNVTDDSYEKFDSNPPGAPLAQNINKSIPDPVLFDQTHLK